MWRWVMGGMFALQFALMGLLWAEFGKLRTIMELSEDKATRALLNERSSTWIPVIQQNREAIIELRERARDNSYRIDQLEKKR